jgi:hypothetical protein
MRIDTITFITGAPDEWFRIALNLIKDGVVVWSGQFTGPVSRDDQLTLYAGVDADTLKVSYLNVNHAGHRLILGGRQFVLPANTPSQLEKNQWAHITYSIKVERSKFIWFISILASVIATAFILKKKGKLEIK